MRVVDARLASRVLDGARRGLVLSRKDARGNVTSFEYDPLGRQVSRTLTDGTVWRNEYCGNLGCGTSRSGVSITRSP